VGKIGEVFATTSHEYFGLLSYVYLLSFVYPLYIINFKQNIKGKDLVLNVIIVLLILFVSLILQSLIVESGIYSGKIGNILVQSLSPFIGNAGLYIFVLVGFVIAFLVLFENSDVDVINIVNKFKPNPNNKIKTIENKRRTKRKEEKVVIKERGNTAEIIIDSPIVPPVQNNDVDFTLKPDIFEIIDEVKEEELKFVEAKVEVNTEIIDVQSESHGIIVDELEENKKLLDEIEVGTTEKPKDFKLPPTNFFQATPTEKKSKVSESVIDQKICDLLDKLSMFKIEGDVVRTYTGPVVTTFEFKPAPNVKVSKILNLQDDLAMALKAQTIRIQAPIPGKDVVGIEVPNEHTQTIYLKEMLESDLFQNSKSPLTMILGKDIVGKPFITDLRKLPHLLIAGTTGSGKSVGINSMILSLLYKNSPDNLKLVMIDPKMLEFSMYNDIPHLLTPVITKAGDAVNALGNMVAEMERRYTLMSQTKTKNIENYNEKGKKEGFDTLPYIVVVIDELADLMMTSGKDVEYSIARLAQMARASGIHLIVAT
jgi:S-DNA-T family DNA segregation ATPase FtsK/SpoIIIE